ncbi:MAG TPA: vanadium-dependent haloperoxidase, partial [Myxococcota bacterium]|nr:vanadium-dependent haloperoxidase [Myxococcota bacterium]
LEATARDVVAHGAAPTIGARALFIVQTAAFDAWAAYDARAVGTRLGGQLRRPVAERTAANKAEAMAYAVYRTLIDVFPEQKDYCTEQMRQMGYDPADTTTDVTKPRGIGNVVAQAVLECRHHDGANQLGDEPGSSGKPYSDYTYYRTVNTPEKFVDQEHWQPIPFINAKGERVVPGFLTPHWFRVKGFALERGDALRPPPPPSIASQQLRDEAKDVMEKNANLTTEQKALVEFMRDGPRSTGQAGHWLRFAQDVSRRDHHGLDEDVKMYFAVAAAAHDAFVACWDAKRAYDSPRPWTLVRHYYEGQQIRGWGGPGKGTVTLPASEWRPYSPAAFLTPPFPGYVSGHSTASGACAEVLRLSTGSDAFGISKVINQGELTEPEKITKVTLSFPTFSGTADAAGISRVLGGYHIQTDNVEGLKLGRSIGQLVWQKVLTYINGTNTSVASDH